MSQSLELICPDCHGNLESIDLSDSDSSPDYTSLDCRHCQRFTPVIHGFPLFPETADTPWNTDTIEALFSQLFRTTSEYREFLHQQWQRPLFDPYAAYYPFNEALQGFLRLTECLRENLKPKDLILDLNCRSGWTGAMLAALFPLQRVISLWEGNQGMLGYSGFEYWLGRSKRAENLEILFIDNREKLPFGDGKFGFLFGFDFLHHHLEDGCVEELNRIATDDAPVVFTHVHTNHSEPDPYFVRGGTLWSGPDIVRRLTPLCSPGTREPCLLSELDVFLDRSFVLEEKKDISHYNCLVMCVPAHWIGRELHSGASLTAANDDYLFVNPLLDINPATGEVSIDTERMGGGVRHLLDRHPAIEQETQRHLTPSLQREQRLLLYWAEKCLTGREIRQRLGLTEQKFNDLVHSLMIRRMVLPFNVPPTIHRLQRFATTRIPDCSPNAQGFAAIWNDLDANYGDHPVLINHDGSEFNVEHVRLFVAACQRLYADRNLVEGDAILILADSHLEVFIAAWAAWLRGMVVILLNPEMPGDTIATLIEKLDVRLLFTDREVDRFQTLDSIRFDDMESGVDSESTFSTLLEPFLNQGEVEVQILPENSPALILGTSGSTGEPKQVLLSHGSLYRSACTLSRAYRWERGERLLSMGPCYSMSGVRNTAFAALQAGTTIIVPSPTQQRIFTRSLGLIEEYRVNIVTTVPAFIENLIELLDQARPVSFPSLRQLLSTASKLGHAQRNRLSEALGIDVLDYYGLTESGGICILQQPGKSYAEDSIGHCDNCLAEIRRPDDTVAEIGESGELWLYTDNRMLGYVGDPVDGIRIEDHWLDSGDEARLTATGEVILLGRFDGAVKNRQGEFDSME